MQKAFSIRQVFAFGWKQAMEHIVLLSGSFLGGIIVLILFSLCKNFFYHAHDKGTTFLLMVILWFLKITFWLGMIRLALACVEYKKISLKEAFYPTKQLLPYVGGMFLYWTLIFCGISLFIIPGIICAIYFKFFPYLIIDKQLPVWDAFGESRKMAKGHLFSLLVLWILILVFNIVCALTFVGLLFSVPVSLLIIAHTYTRLRDFIAREKEQDHSEMKHVEAIPVVSENAIA